MNFDRKLNDLPAGAVSVITKFFGKYYPKAHLYGVWSDNWPQTTVIALFAYDGTLYALRVFSINGQWHLSVDVDAKAPLKGLEQEVSP